MIRPSGHILTTNSQHVGIAGMTYINYQYRWPKAVYVSRDILYFDYCTCMTGGYHLNKISSAKILSMTDTKPDVMVHISEFDGTMISFTASSNDAETFVSQLKSAAGGAIYIHQ